MTEQKLKTMSKEAFLAMLPKVCPEGKQAFLAFRGSPWEYFASHERGAVAYEWCAKNIMLPTICSNVRVLAMSDCTIYVEEAKMVYANEGSTVNLPACKKVENVDAIKGVTINLHACKEVENVWVRNGSTVNLPACKEVKEVWINEGSTIHLPACKKVENVWAIAGSTVHIPASCKLGAVYGNGMINFI